MRSHIINKETFDVDDDKDFYEAAGGCSWGSKGLPVVIGNPEYVGKFPIRQDITVLPADDPLKLTLGHWIEEIKIEADLWASETSEQ